MSSEQDVVFTKENLDRYLRELGKEFRKRNGASAPAEIILIGGAAILAHYGFREMTTDVDAVIYASSAMKDAIRSVGDTFGLPYGWLNSDFINTGSYTPKLAEISVYYRTFSHVLTVRTVSAEYLLAMKLRAGRRYKNDLSDVIGILYEHQKKGVPLSMEQITEAVVQLYGGWDVIPKTSRSFLEDAFRMGEYEKLYVDCMEEERQSREILIGFTETYPEVVTESNVEGILASLKQRGQQDPPKEEG